MKRNLYLFYILIIIQLLRKSYFKGKFYIFFSETYGNMQKKIV